MFPLEENVSNSGKGREQKGVVPDTPFVPPLIPGWSRHWFRRVLKLEIKRNYLRHIYFQSLVTRLKVGPIAKKL